MASWGAPSIRAACEYPVDTQWDCFSEAEVGGGEKMHCAQILAAQPPLRT